MIELFSKYYLKKVPHSYTVQECDARKVDKVYRAGYQKNHGRDRYSTKENKNAASMPDAAT